MKKPFRREKTRLTSPEVRAAATLKRPSPPPGSTRKQEEALLEEFYQGEGGLPMMAYTGRLRPKEVSFSGFRYIKGQGFH